MHYSKTKALLLNLHTSLPNSISFSNLLGNENFKGWLLPRVEAIKKAQYLSQDQIDTISSIRLQHLLQNTQRNSFFWSNRFKTYGLDTFAPDIFRELSKLPVSNKTDLIAYGDEILVLDNDRSLIEYATSGTTGVPLRIKFTHADILVNACLYLFEPNVFNLELVEKLLSEKFILMLGRNVLPHYSSFSEHFPLDSFSSLGDKKTRNQIYQKITHSSAMYLLAYSSVVFEFIRYMEKDRVVLPVITALSGEAIPAEEEQFIYKFTNGSFTFDYNCKEAGKIGGKCHANIGKNRYHVYRERVLVEIVDERGSALGNDVEGNIVITVLDRFTTPIIRYATGDRGVLLSSKCYCGKTSTLLEVYGRAKDFIVLPGGKTFSVLLFRSLFVKEMGFKLIKKYQIVQDSVDTLRIDIVSTKDIAKSKFEVTRLILEKALGNEIAIEIQKVDNIEPEKSGKSRVFIPLQSR